MEEKNKKLMIFLAGELQCKENVKKIIQEWAFDFIAADGGYQYAAELGVPLAKVLGDFDSSHKPDGENLLVFPCEKDESDAELALQIGIREGYKEIWLIAPFGGRVDHTIANLALLELADRQNVDVKLYDGINLAYLVGAGIHSIPDHYRYLSFFPLDSTAELSLYNMKYPLERYCLYRNKPLAISNEPAEGQPCIQVYSGKVICVCIENSREEL